MRNKMRRFVKELDWTLLSSYHNLHEEATERTTLRNPHLPSKRARQGEVTSNEAPRT